MSSIFSKNENFNDSSFQLEELAFLIHETCEPSLRHSFFSMPRCITLLKALAVYVANTPVSASVNLLKADQKFVLCQDFVTALQHNNWGYVFKYFWKLHSVKQPFQEERIKATPMFSVDFQTSQAMLMGQIMSKLGEDEDENYLVAVIIGYWIVKLYMASMFRIKLDDFPIGLQEAYSKFVAEYGEKWHQMKPSLAFAINDPDLANLGVTPHWFPDAELDVMPKLAKTNPKDFLTPLEVPNEFKEPQPTCLTAENEDLIELLKMNRFHEDEARLPFKKQDSVVDESQKSRM